MSFVFSHLSWFLAGIGFLTWVVLGFAYVQQPVQDWIENKFGSDKPPKPTADEPYEPLPAFLDRFGAARAANAPQQNAAEAKTISDVTQSERQAPAGKTNGKTDDK